jgi:predicted nucleic-acid-binding protein
LETFWVLRSRYKVPRDVLHDTLRELLTIGHMEVESFDAVVRSLALYKKGRAEFPDALLAERNLEAGCQFTYTLDKPAAARIPFMELLA